MMWISVHLIGKKKGKYQLQNCIEKFFLEFIKNSVKKQTFYLRFLKYHVKWNYIFKTVEDELF